MYKTIIVPIDLGHMEKVQQMIDTADSLKAEGGKLLLVNVVEEIPPYVAADIPKDLIQNSVKKARQTLASLTNNRDDIEVELRKGQAHYEILAVAEDRDADLIVIASHKPGLKDYFLGSTAARVVRHALCSVHVIR